jgi:hypothetical protein
VANSFSSFLKKNDAKTRTVVNRRFLSLPLRAGNYLWAVGELPKSWNRANSGPPAFHLVSQPAIRRAVVVANDSSGD